MRLVELSMSFGTQLLFNNVNLYIGSKEKVGIIGVNGSGKTTFFKIIMEKTQPDSGKIILDRGVRVDWLPQVIDEEMPSKDITVLDFLLQTRPIEKLNIELQSCYEELAEEQSESKHKEIYKKIDSINSKLDYWDQYSSESTLLKIISGMNISGSLLDQKLNTLSGGQKSKIAFARLLYSKPEIILLDEPTNHLDKESKDFVINYLNSYNGTVFVISDDIDFLNKVTTKTMRFDNVKKNVELFDGNYENFKKLIDAHEQSLLNQLEIQKKEEARLRSIVNLYSNSSGNRKRMAQDREKKLEKLLENKITIAPTQKHAKIQMTMNQEDSSIPLKVKNLDFKYNENSDNYLINNLSFELFRGEKFLIVGQNGIGKSTLLKLIIGQLTPNQGEIEFGIKTEIGYYAQEHELLDNNKTIIENFSDITISQKQLRNTLGRFLFYGEDVFKKVDILSPGERSRVALAKLSLKGSNFLILDEPTNHLDPATQHIIAETFKTFPGTMLIVSHNPEFVDNLGIERTLELPSGEISYYERNKVEYYMNLNSKKKK